MPDSSITQNDLVKYNVFEVAKRRSCELVNTPSPCVKKALFHLERLKNLTKESKQEEEKSLASKQDDSPKKQLRFSTVSFTASSVSSDVFDDKLDFFIQGLGASIASSDEDSNVGGLLSRIQLLPHEVFNQVANLIIRLEDDRSAMERALELERKRVGKLVVRVDDLSRGRLLKLPEAVQKEHAACAYDISELQWHVAYTGRHLERSKEKMTGAKMLNDSLKKDIEFVKEHCPLVEEKLVTEKEAMKKIKAMQQETDQELADAKQIQDEAEMKYKKAVDKADAEREKIRKELDGIRYQLGMLKKDYSHSKAMYQAYVKKAEQSREKLEKQDEELEMLERRIAAVRDQEQKEFFRIQELRESICQVESETGEVIKKKGELEAELAQLRKHMEERLAELEGSYKDDLRKLRGYQETNRDLKFDIEDMKEEIKSCEKAISKAEKDLSRHQKERERMEQQLKVANDDVASISLINIELRTQLEKEEAKSQALEDALKETAENLRKQVNEEMKQRAALETKRQENSKALIKGKSENVKKKQMIERTLEETMQAVMKASDEVKKLQREHDSTMETLNILESKLTEVNREHEEVEAELKKKRSEIEPIESKLQEEQMRLKEKIAEVEFEEQQMTKKLNELQVTQRAMQKRYNATESNIAQLKDDFSELQIQLGNGEKTNADLKAQLDEATARLAEREKTHNELMGERQQVKKQLQDRVAEELATNQALASKYKQLQSEHLDLKNRLMSLYDTKVKMEVSIKDHKQLLALQGKLNHALEQYYHDRAQFNKAGLNKFKQRSHNSNVLMVDVQQGLEVAIENISLFLRSQIDGSAVNRVHQAAMNWLSQ